MPDKVFLDTNILIYLYSESEANKRQVAYRILDNHYCVTNLQALNEASNTWFRKYSWESSKIHSHLDNIELVCDIILPISRATINMALSIKDRYGYSYYDCIMLSSALESNCSIIFTEDMNNGQIISDRLTVINPFTWFWMYNNLLRHTLKFRYFKFLCSS